MKCSVSVKVWGDFACFTRPEMKVERVSYDVMTPSAARGILEAILWKPAIQYRVKSIHVLKPIHWIQFRRNEVGNKILPRNVISAMEQSKGKLGIFIEEERQQRAGLFLRNVAYIIHADICMTDKAGELDNLDKFRDMFKRRVERGQCHHQPVLGCREFTAFFGPPAENETPLSESKDLGWMLNDLDFSDMTNIQPRFFRAQMKNGIVEVPAP
jgi:CRISPR-associated protein Cas5d